VNPVLRFTEATNRHDLEAIEAAFHPEFEMIVPQHPIRGFKGRDQEVRNMQHLITAHPDCHIEVLRMVEAGPEVWIETHLTATDLEMAAAVIFGLDQETDTILWGRYYSDPVERGGPGADEWLRELDSTS
jgi:hypothetical protein